MNRAEPISTALNAQAKGLTDVRELNDPNDTLLERGTARTTCGPAHRRSKPVSSFRRVNLSGKADIGGKPMAWQHAVTCAPLREPNRCHT